MTDTIVREGHPDIIYMGSAPRKKRKKPKMEVLDIVPEKPKRKRKTRKYGRREIAAMVIEDQIELFEELADKVFNAPPMADFHKSGLYNTFLSTGESIWKKMGLDAAMVSEEAVKSALEIVGELWEGGVNKCPECGHRWGKG